jgi:hypothetical protein
MTQRSFLRTMPFGLLLATLAAGCGGGDDATTSTSKPATGGGTGGATATGTGGAGGATATGTGGSGGTTTTAAGGSGGSSTTTTGTGGAGGATTTTGTGGAGGASACVPGAKDLCYSGPPGTEIVGLCKAGLMTCLPDGSAWGPCVGEKTPVDETCLTDGDDDCDGLTNEEGAGCVCVPNTTVACYTGPVGTLDVGECKAGTKACNAQGTAYGPCVGEVLPGVESCLTPGDEDCNGKVNEGGAGCACVPNAVVPCYSGPQATLNVGNCKAGTQACNAQGSAYGPCVGETVPATETCNVFGDEDCDGKINEEGAGCVCVPGETVTCYAGPAGTAGVGACKAGTKTCNAQGTAFGSCAGEVLPASENCVTPADESCTGPVGDPCPLGFAKRFGDSAAQEAWDVAFDAQGNMIVVGAFVGTLDFGGGPLATASSDQDMFVVKLDAFGQHLWSKRFGAKGNDGARAVAVDASGNIWIAGVYQSTVDFGGGALVSANGTTDAVVVELSPSGAHLFSKGFGAGGGDEATAIAVSAAGNVVVGGHFRNTVDFGGGPITAGGLDDQFILGLTSQGAHVFSHGYGDANNQAAKRVAFDGAGSVYFTATFEGTVDYGGGPITSAGGVDGVLVKLSPTGAYKWHRAFAGPATQIPYGLAVDSKNDVVVAGQTQNVVDFGGGGLGAAGNGDVFVAKYTSDDKLVWVKLFGDASDQTAMGVTTDVAGNVIVVGRMTGKATFGGPLLNTAGGNDAFVAKLSSAGAHLWSAAVGSQNEQVFRSVDTDAAGNIGAVGHLENTIDFGQGALTSAGGHDVLVVKLPPQ